MAKLSSDEVQVHSAWLCQWRTPAAMASYVAGINEAMGSADFLNQAGLTFLREAWLAAEFGRHRASARVRLIPDSKRWPDFEVESGDNSNEGVECVEADIPGRRRGDEYRRRHDNVASGGPLFEDDPEEDWSRRADHIPEALVSAVRKKIDKKYPSGSSLLVYLNIGVYGIRQAKTEADIETAARLALQHFPRFYVLWNDRLFQFASHRGA